MQTTEKIDIVSEMESLVRVLISMKMPLVADIAHRAITEMRRLRNENGRLRAALKDARPTEYLGD